MEKNNKAPWTVLSGRAARPKLVDRLTLGQLPKLIEWSGAWTEFREVFWDKKTVNSAFAVILEIRNMISHIRGELTPQQLDDAAYHCRHIIELNADSGETDEVETTYTTPTIWT